MAGSLFFCMACEVNVVFTFLKSYTHIHTEEYATGIMFGLQNLKYLISGIL